LPSKVIACGYEASDFSGAFLVLVRKPFGEEKEKEVSDQALATVLTVDDDPIVRADMRLVLEEAGFAVLASARDGEQAVELARTHTPDVIVLDLALPGVDGVETSRRIRLERDVPIVAVTGQRGGELLGRATAAGVSSYVSKPFAEHELVGAVAEAAGVTAGTAVGRARETSRRAIADVLELLGYPEDWAEDLERRSFAAGKLWQLERKADRE
jgi:CheY-like chemotaxis protein